MFSENGTRTNVVKSHWMPNGPTVVQLMVRQADRKLNVKERDARMSGGPQRSPRGFFIHNDSKKLKANLHSNSYEYTTAGPTVVRPAVESYREVHRRTARIVQYSLQIPEARRQMHTS